jgi:DNA-binding SARP family transcriptional activator
VRYQLLGPFDVFDEDGRSLALGGERQRALLALLVLNGSEVVSTDRIVDSLWEDEPPETANNIIQVYVSRLRKTLEPDLAKGQKPAIFLTRRPGYLLRVLEGELDAAVFSRTAADGRLALERGNPGLAATQLRAGLDLWKGEAIADFAYESFAAPTVARLTEERIAATEDLVDARLALAEHDQLVPELEALVDRYSYRERLHAQLMLALYRSGRQGDALRAYRTAAESLLDELGIDPGPDLQRLEGQILNQDPSLQVPRRSVGGHTDLPLIGRGRHLAALSEAVALAQTGGAVLVRVIGEPEAGVGRLLDEAAALSEAAGLAVLRARAFEAPESAGSLGEQIHALSDTPSALIVQSAHHANPGILAQIGQRLRSGRPTLVVLGQIPLTGRPGQVLDSIGQGATTVDLVVDRVSRSEIADVADPGLAEWLYEQTNGDSFELTRLLDVLRDRELLVLTNGHMSYGGVGFPVGLAPPLGAQVAALEVDERLIVEACSVAGSILPLRVVAGLIGESPMAAVSAVDGLVAAGLLEESDRGVTLSPALSSGRLSERIGPTRRRAVAEALIAAWNNRIEPADEGAFGFVAALGGEYELAVANLISVADRSMTRQNLSEAQPLLEAAMRAMVALGETGGPRWGHVHLSLAVCHRLAGWPQLADLAIQEAIAHADGLESVNAWGWAAQLASDRQNPSAAEWMASVGQLLALQFSAPAKAASLLSLQAQVLNRLGYPGEADDASVRSQQVLLSIGEPHQRFLAAYNQAWIEMDRGHVRHAEVGFAKLLDRMVDGSDAREADLLAWQSRALFRLGRIDEAHLAADKSINLATRTGDVGPIFLAYMARAEGAAMFGHGPDSLEAANEMLGLVLQQLPAWENSARFLMAKAHLVNGALDAAVDEVANALDTCPGGVDGHRWRLTCQALSHLIECERGVPIGHEAEQLVQDLLAARWNEAAVDLLIAQSRNHSDPTAGRQAAELAVDLGLASAAGRAVAVLRAQGAAVDVMVADGADRLVRAALGTMPADWVDGFTRMLGRD